MMTMMFGFSAASKVEADSKAKRKKSDFMGFAGTNKCSTTMQKKGILAIKSGNPWRLMMWFLQTKQPQKFSVAAHNTKGDSKNQNSNDAPM
jgi:hypothetical protein